MTFMPSLSCHARYPSFRRIFSTYASSAAMARSLRSHAGRQYIPELGLLRTHWRGSFSCWHGEPEQLGGAVERVEPGDRLDQLVELRGGDRQARQPLADARLFL